MTPHTPSPERALRPLRPLAAALLLVPLGAHAQQAGVPDSGSFLQQLRPPAPPPAAPRAPALQVQPGNVAPPSASTPFEVRTIRIEGNTAFPTATLHALVADLEGRSATLAQLQAAAARITDLYRSHGFPLSRAVIPAQAITGGAVRIQVLEARYGAVRLDNGSRVNDLLIAATAAPLRSGQAITDQSLDGTLLLLSDIPGIAVNATLKPGADIGTSDLDVVTSPTSGTAATVAMDNFGNRFIGRARVTGALSIFNPLRHGDTIDLAAVTTGSGMTFGRIGYDWLLDGAGTRVGGAYSGLRYELGGGFAALGAHGTADVGSLWLKRPLLRARDASVQGQAGYDAKRLRDRVDATGTRSDRHLDNWLLALNGQLRDGWLGGGQTAWSLGWTRGRIGFDDADAAAADAASARTAGSFSKWTASVSRSQGLGRQDVLALNAVAQWATSNLDPAEKLAVGGPYTVRAYDVGAVSGDTGYSGSVEWRHELGRFAAGRWQALAFVDSARVRINRRPWTASDNSATLSGAGVGLAWEGPNAWRAALSVATRVGPAPAAVSSPSSVRAWAVVSAGF